ncbi:MAG: hypothetical protein H6573_16785 [Lewinellaceae bacterium]|nr:hypothetical protein [Phaeodactylibacter sp.]MCB0611853.1 hypothetical protein [Phaeodactylibacter sp.]MCB9349143.1 hypothetical protein [Lewinellaceae bacterium]
MVNRSIRVKILKETSKTVTIRFMTLNRKMPVPRKEFEKRVEDGLYEVVGDYELEVDK